MPESLASFQELWRKGTSAPLRFLGPGRADAPESDYVQALLEDIETARGVGPAARLDAYRKQYWFRLFTLMQEEYPLAGHLIGWEAFNPLADRFLRAHPPGRNLTRLGSGFPAWLRGEGADDLLVECSRVDAAWTRCFHAPELAVPEQEHLPALAAGELDLGLQPSVQVLRLSRDWLSLRARLDDPGTPLGPPPPKAGTWILARQGQQLAWDLVDPVLGNLLDAMRRGTGWLEALENAASKSPRVAKHLGDWFSLGASRCWWCLRG